MRLVDYLKANNLNRSQFAKMLGISPTHMSDICNKKRNPSLTLTRRIIKITNGKVSIGDLFNPEAPSRLKNKDFDNDET